MIVNLECYGKIDASVEFFKHLSHWLLNAEYDAIVNDCPVLVKKYESMRLVVINEVKKQVKEVS